MFSKVTFSLLRGYSSYAHELGAKVVMKPLGLSSNNLFFQMSKLSFQEAEAAPEGSVVVVVPGIPNQFQLSQELIKEMGRQNQELNRQNQELNQQNQGLNQQNQDLKLERQEMMANIENLKITTAALVEDVKILKITPALMQICESVKLQQHVLIRKFLPDIYDILHEKDKKFSYLKAKQKAGDLVKTFFKNPVVKKLDYIIEKDYFREIMETRNNKAHEALDDTDELINKFNELIQANFSSKVSQIPSEDLKLFKEVNEAVQKIKQQLDE